MTKVTIDFETRSRVDLKKCGSWVYSESETTDIICLAYKIDDQKPYLWYSDKFLTDSLTRLYEDSDQKFILDAQAKPYRLLNLVESGALIEAHNAIGFELPIWENICVKRFGWPAIRDEQWRCSRAKAAAHNLPQSLEGAAAALGLLQQKDKEGSRLMLKMCKPRRPTKSNPSEWWEEPADLLRLGQYCAQDVETEFAISEALMDLNETELKVFQMDLRLNRRGVAVDMPTVKNAIALNKKHVADLVEETKQLTRGNLKSMTTIQQAIEYFKDRGVDVSDLTKNTVNDLLADESVPSDIKRLCEIRQSIGKTSVKKLNSIRDRASFDNRVRGLVSYHRASTGRWGGTGIQIQNFPSRGALPEKDVETVIRYINAGETEPIELLYGDTNEVLSKCLRGTLVAGPGKTLVCSDYSAIEARVLAWLANEEKVIEAFVNNLDVYKVAAAGIFGIKYEEVDKDLPVVIESLKAMGLYGAGVKQRALGKVAVLALGYGGGWRAFVNMATVYGIKPPDFELTEDDYIDPLSDKKLSKDDALWRKFATPIVTKWRDSNPMIKSYWYEIENAAIEAILTGNVVPVRGNVKFGTNNNFLFCQLPSKRLLAYYRPSVVLKDMPWKDANGEPVQKQVLKFWGVDGITRKFCVQHTYSGKLVENIVQAVARDLMAEAMIRLDEANRDIVLTIHDELAIEVPENSNLTVEKLESIMSKLPEWAYGLPLKAAGGWQGRRFRK